MYQYSNIFIQQPRVVFVKFDDKWINVQFPLDGGVFPFLVIRSIYQIPMKSVKKLETRIMVYKRRSALAI